MISIYTAVEQLREADLKCLGARSNFLSAKDDAQRLRMPIERLRLGTASARSGPPPQQTCSSSQAKR
jgi:hypothetical protein